MTQSLAGTGAQALVGSMGTDVWAATKSGFAYLLAAGSQAASDEWEERLEASATLVSAGAAQAQTEEWTTQLDRLLATDPGVEAKLAALVEEISDRLATGGGAL
jgi:hypothetical protein